MENGKWRMGNVKRKMAKKKSRAKRLQYLLHFLIVDPGGSQLAPIRMGTRTDGSRWGGRRGSWQWQFKHQ